MGQTGPWRHRWTAWVWRTTSIGRSIGCRLFLPGWWCWWCWCWVGVTINMNMAGTLRKINRRDVCRGYNWNKWIWLSMAQTDWTPEGQLEDQIWLAMSPFFWHLSLVDCTMAFHALFGGTTTRENLCYITLRSGTWDVDPKLPLASYLYHVWGWTQLLNCAP